MADSKSMWKQYDDDLNNESNPVDNTVLNGGHPMALWESIAEGSYRRLDKEEVTTR